MSKMFGIRINALTIFVFILIGGTALFGIWKAVEFLFPDKPSATISSKDVMQIMQPRWDYEDSMTAVLSLQQRDSIRYYTANTRMKDSLLNTYYNQQHRRDEKYMHAYSASIDELMREWAARYD